MTNNKKKPVLLITGCQKYRAYLEAAIRRMTRPEWEVIGIVGLLHGRDEPTFDAATRILSLPVPDTYEALPTKIHAAFSWIAAERPGIPGVFKTDDDMLFDLDALAVAIKSKVKDPYWGVMVGFCREAEINPVRIEYRFDDKSLTPRHQTAAYCYGWGYWISKAALPNILAATADYKTSFLEDVCTGFVMNRAGIMPARIQLPYKEMERGPELLLLT